MNILELIKNCEVEWKALGEVSEIYGGLTGKSKSDFENGNAKYISYKNIFDNIEIDFSKLELVNISSSENQHKVRYGDVLFTGSSETADEAGMSSAVTIKINGNIYLNSFSFGLRFNDDVNIIPEFSKYLFRSNFMRKEIAKSASGVTRFNISKARFKKIKIPIPPLEVQQKIVKILDIFTELEATLEAELSLRVKQYNYYRDKLLAFGDEVERKSLEEIFYITAGGDVPKDALSGIKTSEFYVPILSNGIEEKSLYGWTNIAKITEPSLTISARGTIGWTSYRDEPFFPIVRLLVLTPQIQINLKYAYYFMKKIENSYKVPESGIPQLTKPMVKDIQIPIPPLETQQRIVLILDKFDRLTNSLTEGLPKEIELRRKQYEYYREQLLAFNR